MTTTTLRPNTSRVALAAISVTALVSGVTTSHASDSARAEKTHARVVRYSELDLTRAHGVTILYDRIKRAAQAVCDPFRGYSLHRYQYEQECVEQAVAEAVAKVGHPNVTAYHRTKTS